jgi:predicted nucleic acid-binding protein
VKIVSSPVYLDASALAKIYVSERDSADLESALVGRRDLIVTDLAVTELTSALARRTGRGELVREHGRRIYERLMRDLRDGEYRWVELTAAIHREAERLLMALDTASLRAADALHLAAAAVCDAGTLVTFDKRMAAAARKLGTFEVVP